MSGPGSSEGLVITADTRRRSAEEKRPIVAEASQAARSVSRVARRHGISPSLLFRWRRELADGDQAPIRPAGPAFIPIALPAPAEAPSSRRDRSGIIEIELAGGLRQQGIAKDCPGID
jgi:transposase